jgi:hypothetical protein
MASETAATSKKNERAAPAIQDFQRLKTLNSMLHNSL